MDQCRVCSCYGKPEECEKQECTFHELWYVKMLRKKLDKLWVGGEKIEEEWKKAKDKK